MEERIAASYDDPFLPRCARILKPGTYGSPGGSIFGARRPGRR